jgi:membrane protein DedA with SNARE-associated domain
VFKALIGVALVTGDFILVKAGLYSSRAHQLHGATLKAYVVGAVFSAVLWYWVLRRKPPAKPARPYVPYGGSR